MALLRSSIVACIFVLLCGTETEADLLYSVNVDSDQLVTIDTETGEVKVVGSIGFDTDSMDLATVDGELYGITSEFNVRSDLFRIDTNSGQASFLGQLFRGTTPVVNAEGLAARNGALQVGFTTVVDDFFSTNLGVLNLDGTIESDFDTGVDMDQLGNNSAGDLFAIDGVPADNSVRLYSIDPTSFIGLYTAADGDAPQDITFAKRRLWGIAPQGLVEIDPADGSLLKVISLSEPSDFFRGLVNAPLAGLLGDVNCDGEVNLLDVAPFIDTLTTDPFNPKADINQDGQVNLLDVQPFVDLLSGG